MIRTNPQLFHEIFESIEEVVWVYDAVHDRIEYLSPSFARVWRRPDLPPPQTAAEWLALVHPVDRERMQSARADLRRSGTLDQTFRIITPDGTIRWIHDRGTATRDEQGQITRIFGVASDITDQRQLEDQLRQAQKMESMGQLASGVAHDFNNWLTVIIGYVELLGNSLEENSLGARYVDEIRRASERATGLTRQLLAFSRKEAVEPRVIDFNGLVADTQKMLRRLVGDDIAVEATLSPEVGLVKVDPTQWVQVLTNLAVNARDAMPTGGRLAIRTSTERVDGYTAARYPGVTPGPFICLTVSDTGCGMTDEVIAQVFEPFFTTKPAGKGTGLGLAVVYSVVRGTGGFVQLSSRVGGGTTFRLLVPEVHETTDTSDHVSAVTTGAGEGILVVDDEPSLREVACFTLQQHGYRVYSAGNGYEALRVLHKHAADVHVLFTDVVMPGMGGRDLVQEVTASWPHIHVIYTTGYTDDTRIRYGIENDEVPFLQKPYSPVELLTALRTALSEAAAAPAAESKGH